MVDLNFLIKIYFGELLLSVIIRIGSLPLSIHYRRQEEVKNRNNLGHCSFSYISRTRRRGAVARTSSVRATIILYTSTPLIVSPQRIWLTYFYIPVTFKQRLEKYLCQNEWRTPNNSSTPMVENFYINHNLTYFAFSRESGGQKRKRKMSRDGTTRRTLPYTISSPQKSSTVSQTYKIPNTNQKWSTKIRRRIIVTDWSWRALAVVSMVPPLFFVYDSTGSMTTEFRNFKPFWTGGMLSGQCKRLLERPI